MDFEDFQQMFGGESGDFHGDARRLVHDWMGRCHGGERKRVPVALSNELFSVLEATNRRWGTRTYEILQAALAEWRAWPEVFERAYEAGKVPEWADDKVTMLSPPKYWHEELVLWARERGYRNGEAYQLVLGAWCWMLNEFGGRADD